eukprot:1015138_1
MDEPLTTCASQVMLYLISWDIVQWMNAHQYIGFTSCKTTSSIKTSTNCNNSSHNAMITIYTILLNNHRCVMNQLILGITWFTIEKYAQKSKFCQNIHSDENQITHA